MSDQCGSALPQAAPAGAANPRDFLRRERPASALEQPPVPWAELTKAECLLWAMALHRAAVAARLSGGQDR